MPLAETTSLPASFVAGDTQIIRKRDASYLAGSWTGKLVFAGPSNFSVTGTNSAGDHLFTISTATTENLASGFYGWAFQVTAGGERKTLETGGVYIIRNPLSTAETWEQEMLTAIRAHLSGRLPAGIESHAINGNPISKWPMSQAIAAEKDFASRVSLQKFDASNIGDGCDLLAINMVLLR